MRSEICSTSRILWLMKMTLLPSSVSLRMILNRPSTSMSVRAAVGSSKISSSAPRYRVFRISTRCWAPTAISVMGRSSSTSRPYRSASSRISFRRASLSMKMPRVFRSPRMMFSNTVMASTSMKCWCTMPMPSFTAWAGESMRTSFPFRKIFPSVGWYSPMSTFISVLFPAPFSPSRVCTSPLRTDRLMSLLA